MATAKTAAARDVSAEVTFLTQALKAPTLRESVARFAERARAEFGSHEEFLIACLQREVSAREPWRRRPHPRRPVPRRKSLEDFDFDHARGLKRDLIAHLATGLLIRACQAGHRVLFATASQWVDRPGVQPLRTREPDRHQQQTFRPLGRGLRRRRRRRCHDRLVHHADVVALKGDRYRLKDRDLGRVTTTEQD